MRPDGGRKRYVSWQDSDPGRSLPESGPSPAVRFLPQDLGESLTAASRNLEQILKTVGEVRDPIKPTRKLGQFKAFFLDKTPDKVLQKCIDDLQWAVLKFDVGTSRR